MIVKDCMKQNVVSVPKTTSIRQAAAIVVESHIGSLPVVDEGNNLVGIVGLWDLLSLELPDFFNLVAEIDYIHDFGAVETTRPTTRQLDRPITDLMQPANSVNENCGLLRAYAILLKHNLLDLPVISDQGELVGIASRVDIGTFILSAWKSVGTNTP